MQRTSHLASRSERGRIAWQSGVNAESVAEQALLSHGWTILLRRARTPAGEIDLVALKDGRLSFIEVKKRQTHTLAVQSISERQRIRIMNGAELLLASHPQWDYDSVAFDVIVVDASNTARRIRDVFWQS
ncbi:YraN family protein [Acetobacter conturbans]|uniref:UPF0102 protein GOB81_09675 n=1 Tax=Acetobacter conturbans TaxID=1737472 RepID=A0ABX0K661_9PROT|nr:YraN family protein [Acetobacter conturbans]NHN88899.1 YraN family protein [Acetobacter conturbans]